MNLRKTFIICIISTIIGSNFPLNSLAQKEKPPQKIALKFGAQRTTKRNDKAMQRWRENRFGQFIHFGLYSLLGGEWNGKNYKGAAEWIKASARISNNEYEKLTTKFSLPNFQAKEWAKTAKEMGVKYTVITTKHHDGFCLWDSHYTNYCIRETPYQKDFLKEYIEAYNAEGIDVYFYYSIIDWNHSGWRTVLKNKEDKSAFEGYKTFMENQIRELITNYPTVKGFWYDGSWDHSIKQNGEFTYNILQLMRSLNKDIICGSRLRVDEKGARHFDSNKQLMGDYEQGWERSLPDTPLKNDWECVMTIPENQWGYHKNWEGHIKNSNEIIEMLAKCISLDGNFVLNFGPKGDGSIRKEELLLAKEIGQWMKINSKAIYGCKNCNFKPQKWGYYTLNRKTNKIYLIVCNTPISGQITLNVPRGIVVKEGKRLDKPQQIMPIERSTKNTFVLSIKQKKEAIPYVIEIQIEKGNSTGNYIAPKT